jgi:hypothetical protein
MPTASICTQLTEEIEGFLIAETLRNMLNDSSEDSGTSTDTEIASGNGSESSSDDDEIDDNLLSPTQLSLLMLQHINSSRYLRDRQLITKDGNLLRLTLNVWIHQHPATFRRQLRVNPPTFHALYDLIKVDPIFHNNSRNEQIPIDQQLAVTLYRLGHFGNGVSMADVGLWAGLGHGTIDRITRRVLSALNRPHIRMAAVHWPTPEEREPLKDWVANTVCEEWRDGWVMVDGTLIPLSQKPGHFGTRWFDRKSNYSLNVQASPYCIHT